MTLRCNVEMIVTQNKSESELFNLQIRRDHLELRRSEKRLKIKR